MRHNTKKGFTLVELLVTISIIAVLTTVTVVGFVTYVDKTNDAAAVTELTQIRDWAISYDIANSNRNGIIEDLEAQASIENAGAEEEVAWGYDENNNRVIRYAVNKRYAYWTLSTGKISNDCDFREGDAPVVPTHECESVCATCGKCTDTACTETVCVDKCGGHVLQHDHAYEWVVTTEPTCMEKGEKTKKCTKDGCTAVDVTEEIAALGHDEVTHDEKAPTCTENGWNAHVTCSRCDYTTKVERDALDHTWSWVIDKEPTYTETGLKHEECSVCGAKQNENTVIDVTDHEHAYSSEETKAPSCTEKGVRTFTCSDCGDTYTEDIAIIDHSHVAVVTAPTCEEKGYTTHTCSVCGDSYTDSEVAALGHSYSSEVTTEPTYNTTGIRTYACTVCGDSYTEEIPIKTCEHNYTSEVTTEATCTSNGVETFTCSKCNDTYTQGIAALGHNETTHAAQAPTCTEKGWDAYITCSRCDHTTKVEKAALGHSYNSVVTPATCTAGGYTTYTCSRCSDSYTGNETVALGHNMITDAAVAPTCTETGLTEGSHCSRCDHKVAQETVNALGHNTAGTVAHKDATCTEAGVVGGTYCTRCNNGKTAAETAIAKLGHNTAGTVAHKDATCTEAGVTGGTYCTRCNDGKAAAEAAIAAKGHTEVTVAGKAATCTATGLSDGKKCSVCGVTTVAQTTIAAKGHTWTAATCTAPKTCSVCGATEGEKLAHSYAAATCTAPQTCSCGATTGSALGHSYSAYTHDSTNHSRTCGRCSNVETVAHSYTNGACVCGSTKTTLASSSATAQAGGSNSQRVWVWSDGTTFTQTKTGSFAGNVSETPITLTANQSFTISSTGITKLVVTCSGSSDAKCLASEGTTTDNVTVTQDGSTVIYTVTSGTVNSIVVPIGRSWNAIGSVNVQITNIEVYK